MYQLSSRSEGTLEPSHVCHYPAPHPPSSQSPIPPHVDNTDPLPSCNPSSVTLANVVHVTKCSTRSGKEDSRSLSDIALTCKPEGLHSHPTSPCMEDVSSVSLSSLSSLPLSVLPEESTAVDDREAACTTVAEGVGYTDPNRDSCALQTQPPLPPPLHSPPNPPCDVTDKLDTHTVDACLSEEPAILAHEREGHEELPQVPITKSLPQATESENLCEEVDECIGKRPSSPEVSDSPFQLISDPLVKEPLPKDRESLLLLRSHMAMELAWLKQAIASRQKVSRVEVSSVICSCTADCVCICVHVYMCVYMCSSLNCSLISALLPLQVM